MSAIRRLFARMAKDDEARQINQEIEDVEMEEEENEVAATMMMMEEEGQSRRGSQPGRAKNLDRRRHARGENLQEDYFIPSSIYPEGVFRARYRMERSLFNRIMTDLCNHNEYFVQKADACGVLGLLPEQKLTAVLRMLAYGAAAYQVDEVTRLGKSTTLQSLRIFCNDILQIYGSYYLRRPTIADLYKLLRKGEQRGFPGMVGSIDCMHWQWKNCPSAHAGAYQNRKGQKTIILEAVASFDTWIWSAFFGCPGAHNDLNVLGQSEIFGPVINGTAPQVNYAINGRNYSGAYFLADGIYPRWSTFVKSIPHPVNAKEKLFATKQEAYRKDVERCFGILQARWGIVRGAVRIHDEDTIWSIMMACIILHNMIVEDEYDYDAVEVLEDDPFNTASTRVYESPLVNGHRLEHPPVERNVEITRLCINRYVALQDPFLHRMRQEELMEHIWKKEHEG